MEKINKNHLEKVMMKAIMSDNSYMARVNDNLIGDIFSIPAYNTVVKFYKNFWEKYSKLPSNEELKLYCTDNDFFISFREVYKDVNDIDVSSINEDILYKQSETYIKEKLALTTLSDIVDKFQHGNINPSELVTRFEKIAGISLLFDNGFNIYNDVNRYISSIKVNSNRLPTGFAEIDKNINGGVLSNGKCLAIVTAPTNVGKSIMLGNIAVNAAKQGKNVLIISLEMSEEVYASRIYSALYDIPINSLPLMSDELSTKVSQTKYGNVVIKEFPPSTMTVEHLDSYIDTLIKNGNNFDLICVDYLTLLHAPGVEKSNDAGKLITRKLRALTYKYNLPIWTACQINREGMGESEPDLKHIAESIAIAAEADLIISLYQQPEDKEMGIMRVAFLKSRLGANGFTINLYFNKAYLRFEDMENSRSSNITETDRNMISAIENVLTLDEIIENAS